LPAYNEEQTIGITLYKVKEVMEDVRRDYKILAMDDQSEDGTWEVLKTYERVLPMRALRNERNMGLGFCLRKFIEIVTAESQFPERDILITVESDYTSDMNAVPSMVRAIEEGIDVVIASGGVKGGNVKDAPFKVKFSTSLLHLLLRNLYGIHGVKDYLSMLRAYRVSLLKKASKAERDAAVFFRTKAANTELLVSLSAHSPQIAEVPCTQRYDVRSRESRVKLVELLVHHVRLIARHWGDRES
jgi:glycosyltransferase involved in cell wall biosynthesis